MPELRIKTTYDPARIRAQEEFHRSRAKIRAYGGAMGGGKSRGMCEDAFQNALDYPGILTPIFRQRHNSITGTTRRTFFEQVLPTELRSYCHVKQSGGEDFIRFPNGSEIHFLGLDDPVKSFSAEYGSAYFDEAHEMAEEDVVLINTRLRQRCPECIRTGVSTCKHYPHTLTLGFNPENPGHWLYKWIKEDAEETPFGNRRDFLFPTDAKKSLGDIEFFFASALDNPFLPEGYVEENLAGMPDLLRRRYLAGEWIFSSGVCYFDQESLTDYKDEAPDPLYRFDFRSKGNQARIHKDKNGHIRVYEEPDPQASYAIGADVASGRGLDYSAAYVTRLDRPQLVCEFRAKIDPDLFAEQLHFLGRWYNSALIAVENQAGTGDSVVIPLRDGKGARPPYTPLYRHVLETRADLPIAQPYGFPMNNHTRPLVLNSLAKHIREKTIPYLTKQLCDEGITFVYRDTGTSPRAQDGCNDDCVMAAAITLDMYRRKGHYPEREARIREHQAPRRTNFPWKRQRETVSAVDIERRYPKGTG